MKRLAATKMAAVTHHIKLLAVLCAWVEALPSSSPSPSSPSSSLHPLAATATATAAA
eukprot:CAMPEP_0171850038 /NCGR_PEP_ID=MMETSP0992-20121227/20058_1 /TAXON_ID=483369 /ORGANISM="non described non described, Strain CCMP2098" /LENGTH=56 /DNA_ID=CAMNT_0012469411 /DNA_START=86 /DNA_END=253 /DNA_ORIENTATION=-